MPELEQGIPLQLQQHLVGFAEHCRGSGLRLAGGFRLHVFLFGL
jgi:uncharacterized protein with von Willebrand factor type A (vWA) domain